MEVKINFIVNFSVEFVGLLIRGRFFLYFFGMFGFKFCYNIRKVMKLYEEKRNWKKKREIVCGFERGFKVRYDFI